jgi:hypothetical protein
MAGTIFNCPSRASRWPPAARKFDHPVFVAPVWLTPAEINEEDARLRALRALESAPQVAPRRPSSP